MTDKFWTPPRWQLITPAGVYDFDRKPWNPFTRWLWWRRGWRWRRFEIGGQRQS